VQDSLAAGVRKKTEAQNVFRTRTSCFKHALGGADVLPCGVLLHSLTSDRWAAMPSFVAKARINCYQSSVPSRRLSLVSLRKSSAARRSFRLSAEARTKVEADLKSWRPELAHQWERLKKFKNKRR
jgi:hypothetical protein